MDKVLPIPDPTRVRGKCVWRAERPAGCGSRAERWLGGPYPACSSGLSQPFMAPTG